jgi:hypothetical protein
MSPKEIQTQTTEIYRELSDQSAASKDACMEATAKIMQAVIIAKELRIISNKLYQIV